MWFFPFSLWRQRHLLVEKQVRNDFSVLDTTGRRISSAFLFGLESEQGKVVTIKEFLVFVFIGSSPIELRRAPDKKAMPISLLLLVLSSHPRKSLVGLYLSGAYTSKSHYCLPRALWAAGCIQQSKYSLATSLLSMVIQICQAKFCKRFFVKQQKYHWSN